MAKQIQLSEGTKIKSVKSIIDFLKYMSDKYSISLEEEYVNTLVDAYTTNPEGKDHIVGFNDGDRWFMNYLSDKEVLTTQVIEEDVQVFSNKIGVKRNGGSNITKPKKKRK